MVPQSARAAITNCHGLGGFNDRLSFLMVLEAVKSKIQVLANLVSSEGILPGPQMDIILPCLHMQRKILSPVFLLIRALIPFGRPSPSWPHHLPLAPPNAVTWRLGLRYMSLEYNHLACSIWMNPKGTPMSMWTLGSNLMFLAPTCWFWDSICKVSIL